MHRSGQGEGGIPGRQQAVRIAQGTDRASRIVPETALCDRHARPQETNIGKPPEVGGIEVVTLLPFPPLRCEVFGEVTGSLQQLLECPHAMSPTARMPKVISHEGGTAPEV
ncbi:hypothetical protein HJG45_18175 [Roseicella sp. DB1501]|nr:hypothetical protein [Roseicella sp. DB1501]NOG72291.1 hypothetical protein [Roseicella sp. DB1501]